MDAATFLVSLIAIFGVFGVLAFLEQSTRTRSDDNGYKSEGRWR